MIEKVIFIGDLLRGNQAGNTYKIYQLFSPILNQAGVSCHTHFSPINLIQDRSIWFDQWSESLLSDSCDHLQSLNLTPDIGIIGFELSEKDTTYLDNNGIRYINLAIHPLRFLDDLHFDIESSFAPNVNLIKTTPNEINLCANLLRSKYGNWIKRDSSRTLAIFGQEPYDKSIYFDNEFKLLNNYIDKIDALAQNHDKVIYKPHPYLSSPQIDELIYKRYSAETPQNANPYHLLLSGNITTACAISSSILTEAENFGLQTEYLEPRAKRFGPPINYRKLIDSAEFWLQEFLNLSSSEKWPAFSTYIPANALRDSFAYWGFSTHYTELNTRVSEVEQQTLSIIKKLEDEKQDLQTQKQNLQIEKHNLQAENQNLQDKNQSLQSEKHNLQTEKQELLNSTSWRITAPLRWTVLRIRELTPSNLKSYTKLFLQHAALYVNRRPWLKSLTLRILNHIPPLKSRLASIITSTPATSTAIPIPTDIKHLTPHARRIYADLKTAIETQKEENA